MLEEDEAVVLAQEKWLDPLVKVLLEKTALLDLDHHGCEWRRPELCEVNLLWTLSKKNRMKMATTCLHAALITHHEPPTRYNFTEVHRFIKNEVLISPTKKCRDLARLNPRLPNFTPYT